MNWNSHVEVLAWAEKQPWSSSMMQCQQDPEWHAEGNVWVHTGMVIAEMLKSPIYQSLPAVEQQIMLAAALLHDCGKPETTVLEGTRIRSPGHSRAGARIARQILRGLNFPLQDRERVINLIHCHGWPPHVINVEEPEMEVIRASWLCRNELLHLLSLSDMKGRIGSEKTSYSFDAVDLWRDVALQYNCLKNPYDSSQEGKVQAFEGKDIRFHRPHENFNCTMTLLAGVPGSGKDTWIKKNRGSLPMVSLDDIRLDLDIDPTDNQGHVINEAREQVRVHLRAKESFVFNATNITREVRGRWIRLARDYNAKVEVVYIEPPIATILAQNKNREAVVPESVVLRLLEKTEVPNLGEAHEVSLKTT